MLSLCLGVAAPVGAQEAPPQLQQLVSAIEQPFQGPKQIRTFQAVFKQQAYVAALDQVEHGKGQVLFERPENKQQQARFRWEYTAPDPQSVISNGQTVWVYQPQLQQVIKTALQRTQAADPLLYLRYLHNLGKAFDIAWGDPKQNAEGQWHLQLTPKRPSPYLQQVELWLHGDVVAKARKKDNLLAFPLAAAAIKDASGNRTKLIFQQVVANPSVEEAKFSFEVPDGVEVLRPEDLQGAAAGKQ